MKRTTVYFPDDMKTAIEREAARGGVTEAEVIRTAVANHLESLARPEPTIPLFPDGYGVELATKVDELLEGFGEDR